MTPKKKKKKVDRRGWIHENEGMCWNPGRGIVWGSATIGGRKTWRACPSYHPDKEEVFYEKEEAMQYIDGFKREGDLWYDYV